MRAFVTSKVCYSKNASTLLGASSEPLEGTIYYEYRSFCTKHDYEFVTARKFSKEFLPALESQGFLVTKDRNENGLYFKNIKILPEGKINSPSQSFNSFYSLVAKLRESDSFTIPTTVNPTAKNPIKQNSPPHLRNEFEIKNRSQ